MQNKINNPKLFKKSSNSITEIDDYFNKDGTLDMNRLVIIYPKKNKSAFGIGCSLRWRFDHGEDEIYILMRDSRDLRLNIKWNPVSTYQGKQTLQLQVPTTEDSKYCQLLSGILKSVVEYIKNHKENFGYKITPTIFEGVKEPVPVPSHKAISNLSHLIKSTYEPGISKIKIPFVPEPTKDDKGNIKKSRYEPYTIITSSINPVKGVEIIDWNLKQRWRKRNMFTSEESKSINKEYIEMKNQKYNLDNISEYLCPGRILKNFGFVVEGFWVSNDKISLRLNARDIHYTDEVLGRKDIIDDDDDDLQLIENIMTSPSEERKELD